MHISEVSDRFIKHPSEVLKVGDVVRVRVIGVDPVKKRINLSMKSPEGAVKPKEKEVRRDDRRGRDNRNDNRNNNRFAGRDGTARNDRNGGNRPERSLDDMLRALQNKFSKK